MVGTSSLNTVEFLCLLLLCLPLVIILHELGHAVTAAIFTKKDVYVFIGSYGDKENCFKLTVGHVTVWAKYNPLTWRKGSTRQTENKLSISKQIIYISAGPVAPFVVAAILYLLARMLHISGALYSFLTVFLQYSFAMLIIGFLPLDFKVKSKTGKILYHDGFTINKLFRLKKYSNEYSDALKFYGKKQYAQAGALFKFLLTKDIRYEDIYRYAMWSFLLAKKYDEALIIVAEFRNDFAFTSDDYCNAGMAALIKHLYEQAKTDLDKSVALNPDNAFAINNIGYYHILTNGFNDAVQCLDRAIALRPSFAAAWCNLGLAKIKMGNAANGLNDLNKALELDACNAYVYRNFGIYYQSVGNNAVALSHYRKAFELDATTHFIDELIREAEDGLIKQHSLH